MFASKLKSLTPGSSKSTSPVPPEFEVDDQIENYINDPRCIAPVVWSFSSTTAQLYATHRKRE